MILSEDAGKTFEKSSTPVNDKKFSITLRINFKKTLNKWGDIPWLLIEAQHCQFSPNKSTASVES